MTYFPKLSVAQNIQPQLIVPAGAGVHIQMHTMQQLHAEVEEGLVVVAYGLVGPSKPVGALINASHDIPDDDVSELVERLSKLNCAVVSNNGIGEGIAQALGIERTILDYDKARVRLCDRGHLEVAYGSGSYKRSLDPRNQ